MQAGTPLEINQFYRKMEGLLNAQAGSVKGDQELRTLKNWDSLTILEFMVLADNDFKSDVQPADITSCRTVDDLARLTIAHSALSHSMPDPASSLAGD
jgi:acyl carrier protein